MKILLDSDALFALYVINDVHHSQAKTILEKYLKEKTHIFVSNLVLQETATVVSYRLGQRQAKDFLERFPWSNFKIIFIGENLTSLAWQIFKKQIKKGISFIDCSNLALCQRLKINKIFSFDKFYQKSGLKI